MNAKFIVSINSGSALIMFIGSFFLLLLGVAFFPAIEKNFVAAGTLLVGSFGGYLVKRNSNNKISLEAEKACGCADTQTKQG